MDGLLELKTELGRASPTMGVSSLFFVPKVQAMLRIALMTALCAFLLPVTTRVQADSDPAGGLTPEILDSLRQSYKRDDVRVNALAANPIDALGVNRSVVARVESNSRLFHTIEPTEESGCGGEGTRRLTFLRRTDDRASSETEESGIALVE